MAGAGRVSSRRSHSGTRVEFAGLSLLIIVMKHCSVWGKQ